MGAQQNEQLMFSPARGTWPVAEQCHVLYSAQGRSEGNAGSCSCVDIFKPSDPSVDEEGYLQKVMKIIDAREVKDMDEALDCTAAVTSVKRGSFTGLAGIPLRSLYSLRSSTSNPIDCLVVSRQLL